MSRRGGLSSSGHGERGEPTCANFCRSLPQAGIKTQVIRYPLASAALDDLREMHFDGAMLVRRALRPVKQQQSAADLSAAHLFCSEIGERQRAARDSLALTTS
jgi:hypothetical protein